jgi:hypothetical protein
MARSHARIFVSVWQDPDWCELSAEAQRVFMLVLSQPKMSNIGVIDYRPAKWARMSKGTTAQDIEGSIAELEAGRFVVVDRDSEELLVRTFVKNDGMCQRWQMVSAMWSAWELVESRMLRRYVLDWLPDEAWTAEKAPPPLAAEQLRHSDPIATRLEPDCVPDVTGNSLLPSPSPTPTPAGLAVVIDDGFEPFWEQYPPRNGKKVDKSKAHVVWRRLSQAEKRAAMTGVEHYRYVCVVGDTLAKDAHRWLRDKAWLDWQTPPEQQVRLPKSADVLLRAAQRERVF